MIIYFVFEIFFNLVFNCDNFRFNLISILTSYGQNWTEINWWENSSK